MIWDTLNFYTWPYLWFRQTVHLSCHLDNATFFTCDSGTPVHRTLVTCHSDSLRLGTCDSWKTSTCNLLNLQFQKNLIGQTVYYLTIINLDAGRLYICHLSLGLVYLKNWADYTFVILIHCTLVSCHLDNSTLGTSDAGRLYICHLSLVPQAKGYIWPCIPRLIIIRIQYTLDTLE